MPSDVRLEDVDLEFVYMNQEESRLPKSVDVAIIGGGIIGVSAARALAAAGQRVAVFEKGTVGAEQSCRNWGWVRTLGRTPEELPLALRANTLWEELQRTVDVGFSRNGLLYLQRTDAEAAEHAAWCKQANALGADARLLSTAEVSRMTPGATRSWKGALYSQMDGVANPLVASRKIADLAQDAGVEIFEQCAVRGLQRNAGRVSAVVTERGEVRAQAVLVAAGVWSRLFCGNEGVDFPQLKVRGSVIRTEPMDAGFTVGLNGQDFTCCKRPDGGYTVSRLASTLADVVPDSFRLIGKFWRAWMENRMFIRVNFGKRFFEEAMIPRSFGVNGPTPFEKCRVLDPKPHDRMLRGAWAELQQVFPSFRTARIAQTWGGYMDVTPDAMPVIAPLASVPGLYLSSGFSGHGFGIGPAAGEATADLILGNTPKVDLAPFNFERFA
jgi:glycine/D-amino acid oxidase-like deaminating enzyme